MKQLHVVDNGLSNVGSIYRMLQNFDVNVVVTDCPKELLNAKKLILPGVGHFSKGMHNLRRLNLCDPLLELGLAKSIPVLGICLGMQILFDHSEEDKFENKGLGLIPGSCKRILPGNTELKVPHMGWNNIDQVSDSVLLNGIKSPRFYFVHAYHAIPRDSKMIAGTVSYGSPLTAVVEKDNIMGTQFHPEKSHKFGLSLFENFIKL